MKKLSKIWLVRSDLDIPENTDPTPGFYGGESKEHVLNFEFLRTEVTPGYVNGIKFIFSGVHSLTQYSEIDDYHCDKHDCRNNKNYCHFHLEINTIGLDEFGQWGRVDTEIICTGIDFYVLKMAYPPHNTRTGKLLKVKDQNDIHCVGELEFFNEAKWKNAVWTNGKVPGLNLINLPCNNTIIISAGCCKVLHIRSSNDALAWKAFNSKYVRLTEKKRLYVLLVKVINTGHL